MYEHYVQWCKEQKVDAKDIKFKFEVGKLYLDVNYGIYVRERDGKRVLVDWLKDRDMEYETYIRSIN